MTVLNYTLMPQMSARPQLVITFDAHHPWISPPIGSDGLEKANVSPRFLHQSASGMPKARSAADRD
jgi:hypothetical protein